MAIACKHKIPHFVRNDKNMEESRLLATYETMP